MKKPESIRYLGATIRPERTLLRAYLPRLRGAGRLRKCFHTVHEAKRWIDENISAARSPDLAPLSPAQQTEYHAAVALLPPGSSVLDAARHYAGILRANPSLESSPPTGEAIREYLSQKTAAGCRPATVESYAYHLRRLPSAGRLATLGPRSLEQALEGLAPRNRNNHLGDWRTFFQWARKRGYAAFDPTDAIEQARQDQTPVQIYSPAAVAAALHHAEKMAPRLVPLMALAAFAGIRSAGLLRLDAAAVDLAEGVVWVPGTADKLRRGYSVSILPNLAKWLRAYPFKPYHVTASYWSNVVSAAFREAGQKPVKNGFRKSFAAYLLAKTNDASFVASQMGQWGIEALLASYRRATTPKLAADYFSICPQLARASRKTRIS